MSATTLQANSLGPSLTVDDLQRSIRFYTDGLGFSVGQEWKDGDKLMGVMLNAGASYLMIGQDDFAKGKGRAKGVGLRLYVESAQDIAALAQRAKAAGIKLDSGPAPLEWGPMGFTVTDPDGFKWTIANPDKSSSS